VSYLNSKVSSAAADGTLGTQIKFFSG
jgi:hypothetical protein